MTTKAATGLVQTTTATTTTTILTANAASEDNTFYWYNLIGPFIVIIVSVAIVIAFCKCVKEICQDTMQNCRRGDNQVESENNSRVTRYSVDTDIPPRYSSSRVDDLDFENNIILETDSERRRRETRLRIEPEEKLPTYMEVIEEDRKKRQNLQETENPAFEPDNLEPTNETTIEIQTSDQDNEQSFDATSISSESEVLPPPSYEISGNETS